MLQGSTLGASGESAESTSWTRQVAEAFSARLICSRHHLIVILITVMHAPIAESSTWLLDFVVSKCHLGCIGIPFDDRSQ